MSRNVLRPIAVAAVAALLCNASPASAQHVTDLQPSGVTVARAAASSAGAGAGRLGMLGAASEGVAPARWSVKRWAFTGAAVGVASVLVYAMARCNRTDVHCNNDPTLIPFLTLYGGGAAVAGGIIGGVVGLAVNRSR